MKKLFSKLSFPGVLLFILLMIFTIVLVTISNIKIILISGLIIAIVFVTGTALYYNKI